MARSEHKAWAKEHFKGCETCTIPSFTRDLTELDEEGIRWDVQQAIKHGFFATLGSSIDVSFEERAKFLEIIADEAKGKILTSAIAYDDSFQGNVDILKHCEKVGISHIMMGYPASYTPSSEDDVFDFYDKLCAETKLPVYVYSTQKTNLERFHPSGLSPQLLSRIADIDNVVGLKLGTGDFGYITDCFNECGEKILVNCPSVGTLPIFATKYDQQWMGAAVYETYQTPEQPYLVDAFNLFLEGKETEAKEQCRKMSPLVSLFEVQMMPMIILGSYHWVLLKYYQWCTGGNGGMLRHPLRIFSWQLNQVQAAFWQAGIKPHDGTLEEFFMGRTIFEKTKK